MGTSDIRAIEKEVKQKKKHNDEQDIQTEAIRQQAEEMFKALILKNREDKTPLQLAIDNHQLWLVIIPSYIRTHPCHYFIHALAKYQYPFRLA